jgi:hypothetical protein
MDELWPGRITDADERHLGKKTQACSLPSYTPARQAEKAFLDAVVVQFDESKGRLAFPTSPKRERGTASIPTLALRASDDNGKLCDFSWHKRPSIASQGRDEWGAQSGSHGDQAGDQADGEHQGQHHCQRAVRYRGGAQQHVRQRGHQGGHHADE